METSASQAKEKFWCYKGVFKVGWNGKGEVDKDLQSPERVTEELLKQPTSTWHWDSSVSGCVCWYFRVCVCPFFSALQTLFLQAYSSNFPMKSFVEIVILKKFTLIHIF